MTGSSAAAITAATRGPGVPRWLDVILSALLGPRDGPHSPLWLSGWTVVRLIGPGSVPLAYVLWGAAFTLLRTDYTGAGIFALPIAVVLAVPVIGARYLPKTSWFVSVGGVVLTGLFITPDGEKPWPWIVPGMFAYWVAQYAIGLRGRTRTAVASWLVANLVAVGVSLTGAGFFTVPYLTLGAVFSALTLVLGVGVRLRAQAQARILEEERLTEQERARRSLLEERARIARDLHDVVAHHMSVISVQASTASYRIPDVSADAVAEFDSIAESARQSLAEMRRLMGVLRGDDAEVQRTPQPGLADLERLVDSTRQAGIPVQLAVADLPDPPPGTVDLTAYRVVQEALSNVVRHAPGAATRVEVSATPSGLSLRVINGPAGPEPAAEPGARRTGHGLAGMRERVAMLDGEMSAGPRPEGGFAVEALLPVEWSTARPGTARSAAGSHAVEEGTT